MGRLQSTVRALSCSPASTKFKQTNNNHNKMAMSRVKQNFHSDNEALINKQINMELYASYVYLSMSAYFARDDIALMGFSKRFKEASTEERDHAMKLIDYQTMRGALHSRLSRQLSSSRELSTSLYLLCTRLPETTTTPRWLTSSRAPTSGSRWRQSRRSPI